ncbi:MAG: metallophosphoesterase [Gemmatimonadota bacterium]
MGEGNEHGRLLRVAAAGDFHCAGPDDSAELTELFSKAAASVDVLLLMGDMTTHGEPEQAEAFLGALSGVDVPILGVLGNHDHESGKADEVSAMLTEAGVQVLDGDAVEIQGVGFAGTKGFCGGFGRYALGTFGESEIKAFVDAAVQEELKLERALAALRTETRVVLLHYSPVADTMGDEPPQVWPFLGSSRLLRPIEVFEATAVFHGHAHIGAAEGRTPAGIPVYNVALPVLRSAGMDFRIWTTPAPDRRRREEPAG